MTSLDASRNNNNGFAENAGFRWTLADPRYAWVKEFAGADVEARADFEVLKATRSHLVARFEREGAAFFFKRYQPRFVHRRLVGGILGSKARREWRVTQRCREKGIAAAPVLAFGERRGWLSRESCLLVEGLPGVSAYQTLRELGGGPAALELVGRIASYVRRLHALSFFHDDLKLQHVFPAAGGAAAGGAAENEFALIDLAGSYFSPVLFSERKGHNLYQLYKSLPGSAGPDRRPYAEAILEGYTELGPADWVGRFFRGKVRRHVWKGESPPR